ncbi:MAG: hypothetical protein LBI34_02565 [Puniceicoccales bacterium]|jgi:hypothetical protein|nr:hypothetical protein [Puniceicoccales bacterium]
MQTATASQTSLSPVLDPSDGSTQLESRNLQKINAQQTNVLPKGSKYITPIVIIGIVATIVLVTATIFFAPGVLAIFLTFAAVLHGGILGVVLLGVAAGTASILVGGLVTFTVAKLILWLVCKPNTPENPTVHVVEQSDDQPETSETPHPEQATVELPQPGTPPDADAPQSEKPYAGAGTEMPETQQMSVVPQHLRGRNIGSDDIAVYGQAMCALTQAFSGQGSIKLKPVPSKPERSPSSPQSLEETRQKVADDSFGGTIPDQKTEPVKYAAFAAQVKLVTAKARQSSGSDSTEVEFVALTERKRSQEISEAAERVADTKKMQRLADEITARGTDGDALLARIEELDQLTVLETKAKEARTWEEGGQKLTARMQDFGTADPARIASLVEASGATLQTYNSSSGTLSGHDAAIAALCRDIESVKGAIASLPHLITRAEIAFTQGGYISQDYPEINGLLSKLNNVEALLDFAQFTPQIIARCNLEIERLPYKVSTTFRDLATCITNARENSARFNQAHNDAQNLFGILLKADDPRAAMLALRKLSIDVQEHEKRAPHKALGTLEAEIAELKEVLGGDEGASNLRALLTDLHCRSDAIGRQSIRQLLAEIERMSKRSALPEPVEILSPVTITEEQKKQMALLERAKQVDLNGISIDGLNEDLDSDEIDNYTEIVSLLLNLAKTGQLPLTNETLENNKRLANLLADTCPDDVPHEVLLPRLNAAINGANETLVAKAIFDGQPF